MKRVVAEMFMVCRRRKRDRAARGLRRSRLSVWLTVALCAFGCAASGCATPPPRWAEIIEKKEIADFDRPACPPTAAAPASDDFLVYLDGSGSMRGYLNPKGASAYRETLRLLTEVGPLCEPSMRIQFRKVGGAVDPPKPWEALAPLPDKEEFYTLPETDLAAAVRAFSVNLEGKRSGPPPRLHVLVTDGVQSLGSTLAASFRDECLKLLDGADGRPPWQATVFGIRSQFNGKVYSEVERSKAVVYQSEDDKATWRPFYLIAFSSDAARHDENIARLRRELTKLESKPEIHELPLSACFTSRPPEVEVKGDEASEGLGPRVARIKHKRPDAPPSFNIEIGPNKNRRLVIAIRPAWSEAALGAADAAQLAEMIDWEIAPVYPGQEAAGAGYPRLTDLQIRIENGATVATVQPEWESKAKTPAWRIFRLAGRLNPKKRLPGWLEEWNTRDDRTVAQANRTYNLLATWQAPWERSPVGKQLVADIYLAVGPK
ncbi:MAG: hypothetical protein CFK52_11065 [Chloracidobacterium sp. CP2_5A]|nr:MAG: hypothetical protein CFK52_11065 [Chloracidobacterium sp. CP2_5A]